MKTSTKLARSEVKNLITKLGMNNVLNSDLNEVMNRTGLTVTELSNAMNYFSYSAQPKLS